MSLKAAIIGLDKNIHQKNHETKHSPSYTQALFKNPDVRLVGVSDFDENNLRTFQKQHPGIKTYQKYHEMIHQENPDIIIVCAPTHQHLPVVSQAISQKPKVIICEPPLSYNMEDGLFMVTECLRNDIELIINHPKRFDPMHQQICLAIQNGLIGNITGGTLYYANGIFNTGTHILDLVRLLIGNPTAVQAFHESSLDHPDPTLSGRLVFSDKANLFLQAVDSHHYNMFEIDIYGTLGRIHLYDSGEKCDLYLAENDNSSEKVLKKIDNPFVTGLSDQLTNLVRHAVELARQQTFNLSTGENDLQILKMILALQRSFYAHDDLVLLNQKKHERVAESFSKIR